MLGDYCDYASFSDLAIRESIDEYVLAAAEELDKKAAEEIKVKYRFYYDV